MPLQLMLFSLLAGVIFIFVPSTRGKKDVVVFVFNIVSNNYMNARKKQYFCFRPKICFWVKFDPKAQNFWSFLFLQVLSKKSIRNFNVTRLISQWFMRRRLETSGFSYIIYFLNKASWYGFFSLIYLSVQYQISIFFSTIFFSVKGQKPPLVFLFYTMMTGKHLQWSLFSVKLLERKRKRKDSI